MFLPGEFPPVFKVGRATVEATISAAQTPFTDCCRWWITYLKLKPLFLSGSFWIKAFFVTASFIGFCLIVLFPLQRRWADGQIAAQSHQFPQAGSGETEAFGKCCRDKRCQQTFIFSVSCPGRNCHHPLFVRVDVKVMLTVEVNGWPVGICTHLHYSRHGFWGTADRNRTSYYHHWCFFMSSSKSWRHVDVSLFLLIHLEEDGDEIKIGTPCKNGGCTKVGGIMSF